MDSYNEETIFYLPGLFRFTNLYEALLIKYNHNRYMFKDNIKIGAIYGSPTAIWNGGRGVFKLYLDKDQLIQVKEMMERFNIPVRFTFTNCLLEEKHIYDTYCNLITDVFNNGNNEIICNSPILETYLRDKYGDSYRYISSTTKRLLNTTRQTEELTKDYFLIVLDYDHNKNFEYLQSIQNKEKCELLINPVCSPRCPYREMHYKAISKAQLNYSATGLMSCKFNGRDCLWHAKKLDNFISVDDINNIYIPMGFKHFKIEGRMSAPLDMIEILLYYLIKDEYQEEIRSYLQEAIW